MDQSSGVTQLITTLITYCIILVPFMVLNIKLARRKGRSIGFAVVMSIIPIVNVFTAIWFASLTDRAVLEKLESMSRAEG